MKPSLAEKFKLDCNGCIFWQGTSGAQSLGECRRNPAHARQNAFPQTYAGDWCGEWKAISSNGTNLISFENAIVNAAAQEAADEMATGDAPPT